MTYRLEPHLVNGRFGDPALYIGFQFEKRGLLLDVGDINSLSPAKLRQVSDLFISHAHLDHFAGFDQLLRHQLEQGHHLHIYGPMGIIDKVEHKLSAYSWNLEAPKFAALQISVIEIESLENARSASFSLRNKFRRGRTNSLALTNGRVLDDSDVVVNCTLLDHRLPCLAFAVREQATSHIVEEKLAATQLPIGPWLYAFKQALRRNLPAETMIAIDETHGTRRLGDLKHALTEDSPQRKICYVTDCQFNARNAERIIKLVEGADILFIEAKFADADSELARSRYHLTTSQAGGLAARARVDRVEAFHFSERYDGREKQMLEEVRSAFHQRQTP